MFTIPGHHHISMITKNASQNNHFYKQILGLRRVKVTVNQDDPSMYHLFYGDKTGSPGTELTFFEIPMSGHTYRGTNAITRIGLLVPSVESLHYWKERFEKYDVYHDEIGTYANRPALKLKIQMDCVSCCLLRVKESATGKHGRNQMFRKSIRFKEWVRLK